MHRLVSHGLAVRVRYRDREGVGFAVVVLSGFEDDGIRVEVRRNDELRSFVAVRVDRMRSRDRLERYRSVLAGRPAQRLAVVALDRDVDVGFAGLDGQRPDRDDSEVRLDVLAVDLDLFGLDVPPLLVFAADGVRSVVEFEFSGFVGRRFLRLAVDRYTVPAIGPAAVASINPTRRV